MPRFLIFSFIGFLAFLVSSPAYTQERLAEGYDDAGQVEGMLVTRVENLWQAFLFTFLNNPSLRAERANLRAIQEEYPQAFAGFLPTIAWDARLNAINLRGDGIDGDTDGAATKELGFSINQPVFRGGRTVAETSEAMNNIYAAEAAMVQEEQEIFSDVVRAYMNLIRDRKALELQLINEDILENRLANSQDLFEAGEATRTDVSQSRARLSRAQSDRLDAEVDLNATLEQFVNLTGLLPARFLEQPVAADIGIPLTIQEVQDIALNNNPGIIEARFEYLSAKDAIDVEYGELLPEISLTAAYRNEMDPGPANQKSRREERLSVNMRVPFFQGGARRSEVREAKLVANQRKLEMMQEIRDVLEGVSDIWRSYQAALQKIELREVQVEAARDARDGVFREVQAGERTYIDLLDADQDLLDAELNLILAERNSIIEAYDLLVLMGRLNARDMELDKEVEVYQSGENLARIQNVGGFLSLDIYEDEASRIKDSYKSVPFYDIVEEQKQVMSRRKDFVELADVQEIDESTEEAAVASISPVPGQKPGLLISPEVLAEIAEGQKETQRIEPPSASPVRNVVLPPKKPDYTQAKKAAAEISDIVIYPRQSFPCKSGEECVTKSIKRYGEAHIYPSPERGF